MAKYETITRELRQEIASGKLKPGETLPSQTALAKQHRVSIPTVQQALSILEGEGLIDQVQGIGTHVRQPPRRQVRRKQPARYQFEKERARASLEERSQTGSVEHDTGLEFGDLEFDADYDEIPADDDLARIFSVAAGTRMLRRQYRTYIRSEDARVALSLIDSYLVHEVAAVNPALLDASREPWPGGTFNQLAEAGIEVDSVTDEVRARPPRNGEAEALGVGPGVAVLVLRKTSTDTSGRVVEFSSVVMPGDRTVMEYHVQLDRW